VWNLMLIIYLTSIWYKNVLKTLFWQSVNWKIEICGTLAIFYYIDVSWNVAPIWQIAQDKNGSIPLCLLLYVLFISQSISCLGYFPVTLSSFFGPCAIFCSQFFIRMRSNYWGGIRFYFSVLGSNDGLFL